MSEFSGLVKAGQLSQKCHTHSLLGVVSRQGIPSLRGGSMKKQIIYASEAAHPRSVLLHQAAGFGLLKDCAVLIDYGAEVDYQNPQGRTALHEAARGGHADVVRLLLERGAAHDLVDTQHAWTPLHQAAAGGQLDVVRALLVRGSAVNTPDRCGRTPLWLAAQYEPAERSMETLKLLLEHGADEALVRPDSNTGYSFQIRERLAKAKAAAHGDLGR